MRTAITTIPAMMLASTDLFPREDAFLSKKNGNWEKTSTSSFVRQVEELFHGLRALGIQAGDRVAILSENRMEWAIADYAAQTLGAVVVPLYATLSNAQIETLLQDCGARLVFVSSLELLQKVIGLRKRLQSLKYLIAFDPKIFQAGVMRLETVLKIGAEGATEHRGDFRKEAGSRKSEETATIIYTSGTTGTPKGAMLTHSNLVSNLLATSDVLSITPADLELSFLPLSHVFQRHVDYAAVYGGAAIAYAENLTTVVDDMAQVRPTFAAGVPRFFEKVRSSILAKVQAESATRRRVFDMALSAGSESVRSGRRGVAWSLADKVVFHKVRERFGGRIRWFVSGGAALEKEVAAFFFVLGLPIVQGYGLTETSPVITLNDPNDARLDSVGKPVGDVEVQLAADGEILVRGSNIMKGYFGKPRETADVLRDGWFHTGDIGVLGADGHLQITDRKKDLIITSSGKNVAPQPIENRLKLVPYFDNVVLIGDRRHFITALIVPNVDAMAGYARANGVAFTNTKDLLRTREIQELAMREIENRTPDLSNFERIRRVAFVETPFSIEGGELTPTMKVRRNVVEEKFRERIAELYAA